MNKGFPDQETIQYIETANENVQKKLFSDSRFNTLYQDILEDMQNEKNIPFCEEYHGTMYHFYQNEQFPKGIYRNCPAWTYRCGKPQWQILFSVADFDNILGDSVFLSGICHNTLKPERVLLDLSPDGQDAHYTLEFDLNTHQLVDDGFHFPLGKNHIRWQTHDSVWVCPAWHEKQTTQSGYPAEVWLRERGQNFEQAQAVFATDHSNLMVDAWRYLDSQGSPIDIIEEAHGFFHKTYYVLTKEQQIMELNLPEQSDIVGYLNGQLLVHLHQDWQRSNHFYLSGSLLAVVLRKGKIHQAHLLFQPSARQTIQDIETSHNHIILHYLDKVNSRLKIWRWQNSQWAEQMLPRIPSGTIELIEQPWGSNQLYFTVSDFLQPTVLLALDIDHKELVVLRKAPQCFETSDYQTHQYIAHSKDGTAIPYFWTGSEAKPETPTLIYVYGGFGISELPHYLGSFGKHWLQKGGAFVVANVRGGGEFGPKWFQQAQKQNKYKSVEDLVAVIDDLITNNRSSPDKIALQGGSNGGLLVANAFVRIPEKIRAVVCEAPLIDMLNFHCYSVGASWIDEYGNPEIEEHRQALAQISPLLQLQGKILYPEILLTTSLSDDRVHPQHALKFARKLQELGHKPILYVRDSGGHAGNDTQQELAKETAMILVFLYQNLYINFPP